MPQALLEEPMLASPDERYFMSVFHDLCASRRSGFGLGCIPVSEILAYCELFRIDGEEERGDVFYFVSELDEEFLSYYEERDKRRAAKSNKARPRKS